MSYTLDQIAVFTGGKLSGDKQVRIEQISIDSRTVISSNHVLFFAIRGERNNGHDYINDLLEKGICNFVVDKDYPLPNVQANYIRVSNTLEALQTLAAKIRSLFSSRLIAITGSNGKTVVKEWLSYCIGQKYKLLKNPKSYNSQVGVPLSVWPLSNHYQKVVLEAGISKPGEMKKLEAILKPDIGVLTNIGDAHQENFESIEQKLQEKLLLFTRCKKVIFNGDDILIYRSMFNKFKRSSVQLLYYSSYRPDAFVFFFNEKIENGQYTFNVQCLNHHFQAGLSFTDAASVENIKSVITVLLSEGFGPTVICELIRKLEPVSMRLEIINGQRNNTIINDTYNSDLHSVKIAIDMLRQQHQHSKKFIVLSDIQQSGMDKSQMYGTVAEMVKKAEVSGFVGVGDDISEHQKFFPEHSNFYATTNEFLKHFRYTQLADAAILLKGARMYNFENITRVLEEKQHRTVLEINFNHLVHNLNLYRSKLKAGTKTLVMVKAFGYGGGLSEIARVLEHHKVDYLGVAFSDEGVELRQQGIKLPVLVLNPSENDFATLVENKLEPELYSLSIIQKFAAYIFREGYNKYPVHIKIDTGMHRLGLSENDTEQLAQLKSLSSLHVVSLFTHLSSADMPEHDAFTHKQMDAFYRISAALSGYLGYVPMQHALNTAGIERFPQYQMNMVRLGIGLYGVSTTGLPDIKSVSTLKTRISQVKHVNKGESVGYGRYGHATNNITIAIIPVGYADGLNRKLGNGNVNFLVNNKYAPTIGNICMDMCMLNITGVMAKEGDEVIIFNNRLPVENIATVLSTIPYEVLTSVSGRVKKVYIHE